MPVYQPGRRIVARLPYEADLIESLTTLAIEEGVATGFVTVIGAVKKATIGYYLQEGKKYTEQEIEEPMEICSCLGNISSKEEETFVHAHITLADSRGRVVGGHLCAGTIVFAAECIIEELLGENLTRSPDEVTGLSLWPGESL